MNLMLFISMERNLIVLKAFNVGDDRYPPSKETLPSSYCCLTRWGIGGENQEFRVDGGIGGDNQEFRVGGGIGGDNQEFRVGGGIGGDNQEFRVGGGIGGENQEFKLISCFSSVFAFVFTLKSRDTTPDLQ